MIDFKDKDSQVPSAIIVASLLILLGTLIFMVARPAPHASQGVRQGKATSDLQGADRSGKIEPRSIAGDNRCPHVFRGNAEDIMARAHWRC